MAWLTLPPTLIISLLLFFSDRCESYPRMHRAVPFRERYYYPQNYPKPYPQQYLPAAAYEEPEYRDYYEPRDPLQEMSDQQLAMMAYNEQPIIKEDPYYGYPAEPEMAPAWYGNPMEPSGYLQDQPLLEQDPVLANFQQLANGYYTPELAAAIQDEEYNIRKKADEDELVKEMNALKEPEKLVQMVTKSPAVVPVSTIQMDITTAAATPEPTTMASEARGQKEVPLYRPPNPSRKVIHIHPTLPADQLEKKKKSGDGDVYATIRRYLRNDKKRQVRSDEQLTHLMKKRFIHQRPEHNIVSSDADLPQQLSKLKGVMA